MAWYCFIMIIQSTFLSFVSEKIEKNKKKQKQNYFSVNLKFLTDVLSNSLKLKLFYILIHPILTYGSESRTNDFTIKDKSLDTLSFEKKKKKNT